MPPSVVPRSSAGPAPAALAAFRHSSAHAEAITFLALAALAAVGIALSITHLIERHGTAD